MEVISINKWKTIVELTFVGGKCFKNYKKSWKIEEETSSVKKRKQTSRLNCNFFKR